MNSLLPIAILTAATLHAGTNRFDLIPITVWTAGANLERKTMVRFDPETGRTWIYVEAAQSNQFLAAWMEVREPSVTASNPAPHTPNHTPN